MNDAEKAQAILGTGVFLGMGLAIVAIYLVALVYPLNWVAGIGMLALGIMAGYYHPRTQHYDHALKEWQKTRDMRPVWALMALGLTAVFTPMVLILVLQWSGLGTILLLLGGCCGLAGAMLHPISRRYYYDAIAWEETYRYR